MIGPFQVFKLTRAACSCGQKKDRVAKGLSSPLIIVAPAARADQTAKLPCDRLPIPSQRFRRKRSIEESRRITQAVPRSRNAARQPNEADGRTVAMRSTICDWRDAHTAVVSETDSSKMFSRTEGTLIATEARLETEAEMRVSERLAIECAREEPR